MDKINDTPPKAQASSSFERGYEIIRLPAQRDTGADTMFHAEDEDMFGDNIEAAAPDHVSILPRVKESV